MLDVGRPLRRARRCRGRAGRRRAGRRRRRARLLPRQPHGVAELLLRGHRPAPRRARATCSRSSRRCAARSTPRACSRRRSRCRGRALPRTIGVVTGESGKARDDVLAGLRRRGWAGRLVWAFAPVQDRHAAPAITRAMQDLAALAEVEVDRRRARRRLARRPLRLLRRDAVPHGRAAAGAGDREPRPPPRPHPARRRRRRQLLDPDPRRRGGGAARLRARRATRAQRRPLAARARRARGRRARRRAARLARGPAEHVARSRRDLHQRAARAARERGARGSPSAARSRRTRAEVLRRKGAAAAGAEAAERRAALDGLTLALDRARPAARPGARLRARRGRRRRAVRAPPRRAHARERAPALRRRRGRCESGGAMRRDHPQLRERRRAPGEIIERLDSGEAGLRETLDLVQGGPRAGRVLRRRARGRQQGPRGAAPRRAGGAARGERPRPDPETRMSTYDRSPACRCTIDGYALDGPSATCRAASCASPRGSCSTAAARRASARTSSTTPATTSRCRPPGPTLPLAGDWTLRSFCERLEALDLFPRAAPARGLAPTTASGPTSPPRSTSRCARPARAARVLGREPRPVTFVCSLRLDPASRRARAA